MLVGDPLDTVFIALLVGLGLILNTITAAEWSLENSTAYLRVRNQGITPQFSD